MFKKYLEFKIEKNYKSKILKLLYGFLFIKNIEQNTFAKANGVIEILSYYKILKKQKISKSFVKNRFNNASNGYEATVGNSSYEDGELGVLIVKLIQLLIKNNSINCLELGCGTGLVGEKISKQNIIIVGVDLSENMLQIAKQKDVYDELHCVDIEKFLTVETRTFDLIYACSVIQFFDDNKLNILLLLLKNRLSNEGVFVFTFDLCEHGIQMNDKFFMEHSLQYIKLTAKKYFINVEVEEISFGRVEQGKVVKCGLAIISQAQP